MTSGTKKHSRYHPDYRESRSLIGLKQVLCHGNGARRNRLITSAVLLGSETSFHAHTAFHQPTALCNEGDKKNNSVNAFKVYILGL
jgi:hypothetical protein